VADNAPSWTDILSAFMAYPEKIALLLVLFAGAWRWLRELWVERKDDSHHESIIEILMKENRELRVENKDLREELRKNQEDDR
jgi:ABC-type nickel/cobalt efflux system permease component RcnA